VNVIEKIDQENRKADIPPFEIGDAVKVHVRIKEGTNVRTQIYAGTVIARDGSGSTETFTVRRISYGEGVERVFPVHAPVVEKLEIERKGNVRRAKLYYARKLKGKKAKLT
jgi:large subunit ribosomal protein L19